MTDEEFVKRLQILSGMKADGLPEMRELLRPPGQLGRLITLAARGVARRAPSDAKAGRRRKMGDYVPDAAARALAIDYWKRKARTDLVGNIEEQVQEFLAHHRSRGTVMEDWNSAWQTWYANAVRFVRPPPGSQSSLFGSNGFEGADDDGWRLRLRVFYGLEEDCEGGGWHPKWGPKPGEQGCKVPEKILQMVRPSSQ